MLESDLIEWFDDEIIELVKAVESSEVHLQILSQKIALLFKNRLDTRVKCLLLIAVSSN